MDNKYNRIKKPTNIILVVTLGIIAFLCVAPYILSISISLTSSDYIAAEGFALIPREVTTEAYQAIFANFSDMAHAYLVSIVVTVLGTMLALSITMSLGYVISRKDFKYRNSLTFFIFFTMLFNAGMTANYMVMTSVLGLYDTIWALILPLVVNPFWIFMARTFFMMTIPDEMIESARIDGANEITILRKMVLPVSLPIVATIGLFSVLTYWNDWFNAKMYIESDNLVTLQYYLVRIQESINYLIQNAAAMGTAAASASEFPTDALMMAVMVISTLPLVVAYPFFQRYFISGLTIGAIK